MSDPLGFISGQSVRPAGLPGVRPATGGVPTDPGVPGFKDALLENLKQVNQLQQDANQAIEDVTSGKRDDVEGVILATQKADSAFRMLQAVRNRVMEAYDEIKQVRV
mgnify:CR=1 FL=1